ncbi:4-oxalomesaconate tautomerase [Gordonia sinesedis]
MDHRTMLLSLPAMMMRGGTSRGMFFLESDLIRTGADLDTLLPALMGSPARGQIDGLGGGSSTTSKVAIVSPSPAGDCDVDYLFAQVSPDAVHVDWSPTCGNVLAGVGPFAIERALVTPTGDATTVRVRMVNTGARADCVVATPGGQIAYDAPADIGDRMSPATTVAMTFRDYLGGTTGTLFPTGKANDVIDGVEITAIDASVCAIIARAADLGITGREPAAEINANTLLLKRIAELRLKAGEAMGMGDVGGSVLPKVMLVGDAPAGVGAGITSRYFVPATCHPAHAVSGAVCLATASTIPDTLPAAVVGTGDASHDEPHPFDVAHPSGRVSVEIDPRDGVTARIRRTARKLFDGQVFASLQSVAC